MSRKTASQMEVVLMDKIEKAKRQLEELQKKHKLEIGSLAYKHGLHEFDTQALDSAFSQLARELRHEHE